MERLVYINLTLTLFSLECFGKLLGQYINMLILSIMSLVFPLMNQSVVEDISS